MTREDIIKNINNRIKEINKIDDPVEYVKEKVNFLRTMHPSDAYQIVKDMVPGKDGKVFVCKKRDVKTYQEFQDLLETCKQSYKHDNDFATNLDVDRAVSKAYGMTLRMIRVITDTEQNRFDKITSAINRIEERLGLDVTDFGEGERNDSTELEDAQRIEEVADGTGATGKTE